MLLKKDDSSVQPILKRGLKIFLLLFIHILRASTGFSFAALQAGYKPNKHLLKYY